MEDKADILVARDVTSNQAVGSRVSTLLPSKCNRSFYYGTNTEDRLGRVLWCDFYVCIVARGDSINFLIYKSTMYYERSDRFWGRMPLKEETLEAVSRMEFIQFFVLGGLPRLVIVDNRRALNIVFLEF